MSFNILHLHVAENAHRSCYAKPGTNDLSQGDGCRGGPIPEICYILEGLRLIEIFQQPKEGL